MERIRWLRAILNGLLAWFLGFLIVTLPGLIYGTIRGFELGRSGADPGTIQTQIAADVTRFYQENWWLTIVLVLLVGLVIFWRARAVARGTGSYAMHNALIVGAVPTLIALVFDLLAGLDLSALITVVVYMGAAALAGYLASNQRGMTGSATAR